YLTPFDHWIKETMRVKNYFRYADDMVILSPNKRELHDLFTAISSYLATELKLTIKGNHRIFPVASCGIVFLGYAYFHTHTLLRKTIKKSFARAVAGNKNKASIASYLGWAKYANTKNLIKKLFNETI